jgi:hypothetical protein
MKIRRMGSWLRTLPLTLSCLAIGLAGCGGGGGTSEPGPVGLWTGTYNDFHPYQFVLFPGGAAHIREGTDLATGSYGSWMKAGTTIVVSYTFTGGSTNYNVAGALDGDTLVGTWGTGTSSTDGGPFALARTTASPCGIWEFDRDADDINYAIFYPDKATEAIQVSSGPMILQVPIWTGTWELSGTVLTSVLQVPNLSNKDVTLNAVLDGDQLSGMFTVVGYPAPLDFQAVLVE